MQTNEQKEISEAKEKEISEAKFEETTLLVEKQTSNSTKLEHIYGEVGTSCKYILQFFFQKGFRHRVMKFCLGSYIRKIL